jgi:hypothetical protein
MKLQGLKNPNNYYRRDNMRFIQCNCLTKTPEPKYHMQNCPVWMADRIKKLEELLSYYCESLQELENRKERLRAGLKREGQPACNVMFHHTLRKNKGAKCPYCKEQLLQEG